MVRILEDFEEILPNSSVHNFPRNCFPQECILNSFPNWCCSDHTTIDSRDIFLRRVHPVAGTETAAGTSDDLKSGCSCRSRRRSLTRIHLCQIRSKPHLLSGTCSEKGFFVHWCTVFGNPGGGSLVFRPNSFEGYLGLSENLGVSPFFMFNCIFMTKNFGPKPPLPLPPWASMFLLLNIICLFMIGLTIHN